MLGALAAGLVSGSSLLLGGLVALLHAPRERTLGLIMAFGAGVLLSAVAYDLILEAQDLSCLVHMRNPQLDVGGGPRHKADLRTRVEHSNHRVREAVDGGNRAMVPNVERLPDRGRSDHGPQQTTQHVIDITPRSDLSTVAVNE